MHRLVPVVALLAVSSVLASTPPSFDDEGAAGATWPSPDAATIRPGVRLDVGDNQCTANFIYQSADNATLYLGMAAHCATYGDSTQTNGCETTTRPVGTPVTIAGASQPGIMTYSSWATMQALPETDLFTCAYNDFALVHIHPADRANVHPAMLYYGGPTSLAAGPPAPGTRVLTVGASETRPNYDELHRHEGTAITNGGGGWTTTIFTATPGIPGDSGSGVMRADGAAVGTVSTVSLAPVPASNGMTTLAKSLAYAHAAGVDASLATWNLITPGVLPP